MRDYLKRFFIVGIMALCIGLLFLGGKHSQAEQLSIHEQMNHWIWPTEGVVTDIYGTRGGNHKGIDIAGGLGTPVHAVASGKVSKSYYSASYGHVVFVKHDDDVFETVYAHLHKRFVKEGQTISQGQKLGEMGNTGQSSGVHLHFEIHQNEWTYEKNNAINPTVAFGDISLGEEIAQTKTPVATRISENDGDPPLVIETAKMELFEVNLQTLDEHGLEVDGSDVRIEEIVHEVVAGDTLWAIANHYEVTVESIVEQNDLSSDLIHPNQQLIIKEMADDLVSFELLVKKMKHVTDEQRAQLLLQQ